MLGLKLCDQRSGLLQVKNVWSTMPKVASAVAVAEQLLSESESPDLRQQQP